MSVLRRKGGVSAPVGQRPEPTACPVPGGRTSRPAFFFCSPMEGSLPHAHPTPDLTRLGLPHSPRCPLPRAVRGGDRRSPFEFTRVRGEGRAMLTDAQYAADARGSTERPRPARWMPRRGPVVYLLPRLRPAALFFRGEYEQRHRLASFWDVLPDAIGTMDDRSFFVTRTECHCRRCGSHVGPYLRRRPAAHGLAALPSTALSRCSAPPWIGRCAAASGQFQQLTGPSVGASRPDARGFMLGAAGRDRWA